MTSRTMLEPPTSAWQAEYILTAIILVFVLLAAGAGVFIPGFYQGIVDPQYAAGTITADLISLMCVPLLVVCMVQAWRGSLVARLAWTSLVVYLGYAYAVYAFDRMYTVMFPLYIAIFSMSCFVIAATLSRLDIDQLALRLKDLRLRQTTAIYLAFTGLILYVIEVPIILSRIPDGTSQGGTPFMVLDMALVAPIAILTGIWLWQRRPWGFALAGIFLVKAVTLMTSFLLADYYNWFIGELADVAPTIAFTVVNVLAYGFVWNYLNALRKKG